MPKPNAPACTWFAYAMRKYTRDGSSIHGRRYNMFVAFTIRPHLDKFPFEPKAYDATLDIMFKKRAKL